MSLFNISAAKEFCCTRWLLTAVLTLVLLGTGQMSYGQYCTNATTNTTDEWISNVTFAGINNNSGSTFYSDFTAQVAEVDAAASYPFSLTVTYGGTAYTEHGKVWIDWDQNEIWEADESYYFGSCNTQNCVLSGTINVPADAVGGETRMRVILRFNTEPTDACTSFAFGEIEDYTVNVSIPDCLPPLNFEASNILSNSADVSFDNVAGDVYIEYGEAPFTPGTDANAGGGTVEGPVTSPVNIDELTGSTDYAVYIRQECSPGVWSPNSIVTFTTLCDVFGTPFFESFEDFGLTSNATWPEESCIDANPSSTTTAYRWDREDFQPTSGITTGPSAPHDGAVYAYTESTSGVTNDVATLDLGPIDLSALSDPALTFYYHMHGAAMGSLNVYVTDDGSTWDLIASYTGAQQQANTDPWIEEILSLGDYSGETISVRFEGIRGTSFTSDMAIDAVSVDEAPSCFKPTFVVNDGVTLNSADLSWTCDGCTGNYYIEYGAPGFTPGTGAAAGDGTVFGPVAGLSATVPGLSANTTYDVYVRQDCGIDGVSDNSTVISIYTGTCVSGGPTNTTDSNVEGVAVDGIGATAINFTGCPGVLGVQDLTAQSADVSEILSFDVEVTYGTCSATCYGGAGTVWVDWNENLEFESSEVVGSNVWLFGECPITDTYNFTVPPGTALGPKTMRVMQWEGGTLPLDPCATFNWGSVMDFTLNVVAPPDCTPATADFTLLADCDNSEFSVEVDVTSTGDSSGGVVDITNTGGEATLSGVGVGTYVIGPFAAGSSVSFTVVNLNDELCNLNSGNFSTNCVLCTAGGPTSTADSNVELVQINGFDGSGFSHDGCPATTGVENLTSLEVDIPTGFTYNLSVVYGTCGGTYTGVGSVWIDWNGDYNFSIDEVVGSTSFLNTELPFNANYAITPPPGTTEGSKVMRVMQWEGGSLPLDPCASFNWGSVMDFTVNVVPNPGCMPATGSLALTAGSCDGVMEFSVDVTITDTGDSPGGVTTISNNFDATTIDNVGPGVYTIGPFPSGTDLEVQLEHLGMAICNTTLSISEDCPPLNDHCEDVTPVTMTPGVSTQFSGTTAAATTTGDGGFEDYPTVWHAIEITGECNTVTVDYCGNDPALGNVWLNLGTACPATTWLSAGAYENTTCPDGNYTIEFAGVPAGIYYVPVMGFSAGFNEGGPYTVNVLVEEDCFLPTDECVAGFSASPGSTITNTSPTVSTINVAPQVDGSYITDMDVAIDITHTWVSDVTITLTSPCGTTITLIDGPCADEDNLRPYFDDEATDAIEDWCTQRFGPVIPGELLSAFDNETIEGDWTLEVTDAFAGDNGTLVQWCLVPTLDDICVAPVAEVIDFTDQSITLDLVGGVSDCFDTNNYDSFDIVWSGGSANGVSLPYEVTGLDPGTLYLFDVSANCTESGSSTSTGVTGTTLNCAPEDACTYELTLSNSTGSGWEGAFARVNNGWTTTDYFMDPELQTQTWTIFACPGNPLSVEMVNGGNGSLASNFNITLTNSDEVVVFSESGPDEVVLYSQANGCPDCAQALDIEFSRLAADLVEVSWTNIELPANVDDIQVIVLIEDIFSSIEIANETFAAGTSSASIVLDGSYPFTGVTVQIVTNCADDAGAAIAQSLVVLPGCDAADQCEYQFNLSSSGDGWGLYGLDALIDGTFSIPVHLDAGSSGTQSIFTCGDGTISIEAISSDVYSGCTAENPDGVFPWPTGTFTPTCSGIPANTGSTICYTGEYSNVNVVQGNAYEFSTSIGTYFITITDANGNVLASGEEPLAWTSGVSGTIQYWTHLSDNCDYSNTSHGRIVTCFGPASTGGCSTASFELILNPSSDNVTLVNETDFCDFENEQVIFSGETCPSCFPVAEAVITSIGSDNVEVEWNSANPAGTEATVYVGLPGFDPLTDPVSSTTVVSTSSGMQGPVTVSGLESFTEYEVLVIEDCGSETAGASPAVPFTTQIGNDNCVDATPLTIQTAGGCPAGETTGTTEGATNTAGNVSCIGPLPNPLVEVWYTFNSGSNPGVLVSVSLGTQTTIAIEVLDACNGNVVFCTDGTTEMPAQIAVDPNTDYYIRIATLATTTGTHGVCVSAISGCTDPSSPNYNPLASVDDGSCIACDPGTSGVALYMEDSFGDGWNGAVYNIYDNNDPNTPVLLHTGDLTTAQDGDGSFVGTDYFCLADGCYLLEVTNGSFPGEITWELTGVDFGPIDGTPTTGVQFSINGGCSIDGCTNPLAVNYNPAATDDDGSCIIPDCTDPSTLWTYCYGPNDLSEFYFPPLNPGDDVIIVFEQGGIENNNWDNFIVYDGATTSDPILFANGTTTLDLTGMVLESTNGNGLLITYDTDGSVSCSSGSFDEVIANVFCGLVVIEGCTDPSAPNYNPNANVDDGSCILCEAGENLVTLEMFDSFGDGWNGAAYTVSDHTDPLNPVVVATGDISTAQEGDGSSLGIDYLCLQDGCFELSISDGSFPGEISWNLIDIDGGTMNGAAPNGTGDFQFTINGVCQTIGCTDPSATNYDPEADVNDGSCVYPPVNNECGGATAITPVQYPATANMLGTISGATTDGSTACSGTNGPDVFYTFNVPLENHYWINLNPFGGFNGVVEVLDACDGTVIACELAPPVAPFCDEAQSSPGFAGDADCEEAVCNSDSFCCDFSWDGICAGAAAGFAECADCLTTAPVGSGQMSLFLQNLPAGDYIIRVRDYYGDAYSGAAGNFLINVQYFPIAKVQDNPNNFLFACNQTGFQLEDFVGATPQSGQGALDYQWLIAEQGATENWTWTRGGPNYSTRIEWLDMEYGKTYNVYVRILMEVPGHGQVWGVFQIDGTDPNAIGSAECTISTGTNVTPTELRPNYTPTNVNNEPYSLCDIAVAYQVSESQNFRWRFDPDMDPNNGNEIIYVRGSGNPSVMLHWVNGLVPGTIYNVAVEVQVQGQWSGYSTVLPLDLALPPNDLAIRPQYCNTTMAPNGVILAESVCEADYYSFEFVNTVTSAVHTRNTAGYALLLSYVNPPLTPGVYDVRVKVTQNGMPGDFGPVCQITIGGSGMAEEGMAAMRSLEDDGSARLFPNPNAGNEVRIELDGLGDGNHDVNIVMYDIYGKQVSTDAFGHDGDQLFRLIRFDEQLAMGMYMVHVFVDGEQFTVERLVVK